VEIQAKGARSVARRCVARLANPNAHCVATWLRLACDPVTAPIFTIATSDVERDDQHRTWTIPLEWLGSTLTDTEARPTQSAGQLTVHVFKNGQDFLVRGKIQVEVQLPCARTLDPAIYDLSPELFLVLRRREIPADKATRGEKQRQARAKNKADEERLLSEDDAASDTFSGDQIALDDFVREQILLELPMFPLRSDLRSQQGPAIPPHPPTATEEGRVDPRLAPLLELKAKLKSEK
jgi:uncharacterized protein